MIISETGLDRNFNICFAIDPSNKSYDTLAPRVCFNCKILVSIPGYELFSVYDVLIIRIR